MIPTLNVGDLVIIKNNKHDSSNFNNLKEGDIIVFTAPYDKTPEGENRTIIHRIINIESSTDNNNNKQSNKTIINTSAFNSNNKTIVLKTKGDANNQSYYGLDYPITENLYKGKVFFVIPKIGKIFTNNSLFNIN